MLKKAVSLLASCGGAAAVRQLKKSDSLTILSLHRVSPELDFCWQPLRPDRFDALCAYVKRHYRVLNLRDLADPLPDGRPRLVLSFDDGYHDFIEYALPILYRHGLPANHNLVVDCLDDPGRAIWTQRLGHCFNRARARRYPLAVALGGRSYTLGDFGGDWMKFYLHVFKQLLQVPTAPRHAVLAYLEGALGEAAQVRMMTWDEVRTLADYNIEVGSHTYSHDVLPTITDAEVLHRELMTSRQVLAKGLGQPIDVLGLPNGQNTPALQPVIEAAGYTCVLETGDRGNPTYRHTVAHPACFHRINVVDEPAGLAQLRIELLSLR